MISIENLNFKNKFSLGIDFFDEDYREIFEGAGRILSSLSENSCDIPYIKDQLTMIKVLTEKHFEAEEGYMRFALSGSFMYHKHCHDIMRERILPLLKKETEAPFSKTGTERILGTYLGWTASHILFEDAKLTDKDSKDLKHSIKKDTAALEENVSEAVSEILKTEVKLLPVIPAIDQLDDFISYERIYNLNDETTIKVKAAFEEELLLSFFREAFGISPVSVDTTVKCFLSAFTKEASQKLISFFSFGTVYEAESEREMTSDEMEISVFMKKPAHCLSFKTAYGSFMIFADKI